MNNDASLSKDCFIVPGSLSQSDEGAHLLNCQIQMPTHQFKGAGEARNSNVSALYICRHTDRQTGLA